MTSDLEVPFVRNGGSLWVSVDGVEHLLVNYDRENGTAQIFVAFDSATQTWVSPDDEARIDTIDAARIEHVWRLHTRCTFRGLGPFETHGTHLDRDHIYTRAGALQSTPRYLVNLEYLGDDTEAAAALPEMEVRGPFHPLGAGIGGKVWLSEITDYTEFRTPHQLPGRQEH